MNRKNPSAPAKLLTNVTYSTKSPSGGFEPTLLRSSLASEFGANRYQLDHVTSLYTLQT